MSTRVHLSLRIPADDKAHIEHTAHQLGLTVTEYIIQAATGRLDSTVGLEDTLATIHQRLERLEAAAF